MDSALTNWLQDTGRDIARAVGSELKSQAKDKAVSMAKEQLGLGLADELKLLAGDVGSELRTAATQKVVSMAKEQLGLGLADELKSLAGDVGSELKGAAKKKAMSMAKDKFEELATQYFGGAGTKEQAVRVCAYTVTTLRKIVTAMRRDLNKLSPSEYLRIHAVVALENNIVTLKKGKPMNERLDLFLGYLARSARSGGYSAKEQRELVKRIKKRIHGRPVSQMPREALVEYIYDTAMHLSIDWTGYFEQQPEARRVRKGCYKMTGPGEAAYEKPRPRAKRPLSAYNKFVQEMLTTYNFPGDMDQKQKMREVSKLWAAEKESILNEEHFQAVDREDRIEARKNARQMGQKRRLKGRDRKVPKKGADDDLMLGEGLRDLLKRKPSDAERRAALQAALANTPLGQPIRGTSVASSAVHMAKELLKNQ